MRPFIQCLFLAIVLKCGVEYRIVGMDGKVNFYLVKEALPNGDYVAYSPARWIGIINSRPAFEYKIDDRWKVILHPADMDSAEAM